MRRSEFGTWCEPCAFCGEEVTFDGIRRYDPEGFPFLHECPPAVLRPLNERDFSKKAVGEPRRPKKAKAPVQASIQAVPGDLGGVPL